MSVRNLAFLCSVIIFPLIAGCTAHAEGSALRLDDVLSAAVEGRDHIEELRASQAQSENYPSLVAALTDYEVLGHGVLIDLVLDEGGEDLVPALRAKLRTSIDCLPQYPSICHSSLANRNEEILRAFEYLRRRRQQLRDQ